MAKGRPPKPTEIKRATGNPGQRKLPELATITPLPMATQKPTPPEGLGADGIRFWDRAWDAGITWISPLTDLEAIENAAVLADAVTAARKKYLATLEAADGRAFVQINKAFVDSLTSLGFDPVSRSRLGVAEVKAMSALDQLIAKRQSRQ